MNKRIKGIAIASLQNHEHYGFVTEVKLAIEQANIDSLATLLAKFTPLVEEENKSLEIVAKSEHTHRLKELDRNRDNMFRGLSACVNEASYSPTKDEKEAATLIKILLKRYGNIISESFESQHSKTENLIQDLHGALSYTTRRKGFYYRRYTCLEAHSQGFERGIPRNHRTSERFGSLTTFRSTYTAYCTYQYSY